MEIKDKFTNPQTLLLISGSHVFANLDLLIVLQKLKKAKNQAFVVQFDCAAYCFLGEQS